MRGVAQTISYEISLALILISIFIMLNSLRFNIFFSWSVLISVGLISNLLFIWLISAIAETNRSPFDFAERESELVSGFNIEYGRGGFALIFMAEYCRILLLSFLTRVFIGLATPKFRFAGGAGVVMVRFI